MKKLLLALCLMLALLVGVAAAENTGLEAGKYRSDKEACKDISPTQAGNYWYIVLKDGTAEIVKYTGSDNELLIPAKLDGISVTSLGYDAFYRCNTINNVTIPDSVTFMGEGVFMDCSSLTSITLPVSLPMGLYATFLNCTSLNSIVLPTDISRIATYTFYNCPALTSLVIPDSVTRIDDDAFDRNITLCVTPFSAAEKHAIEHSIPYVYTPAAEGWTCPGCMNYNEDKFCTECGTAKPEPTATPAPTPVDDGSWDCTCGSHNTGKFCGNCGTKKPEPNACPNCGHVAEGAATQFCTECGTKFQ